MGLEVSTPPGGGSTPTGTGVRKVVAGVEAAAASLVVNADVDAAAAIAVTKLAAGAANTVLKGGASNAFASIVNADIDAAAAIAGTKVSPDFGAQNIVTTGYVSIGASSAATGSVRLPNNSPIYSRNAANSADLPVCSTTAGDNVVIGGTGVAGVSILANGGGLEAASGHALLAVGGFYKFICYSGFTLNASPILGSSTPYGAHGRETQAMADANQTLAAAVYSRHIIRTTGALTVTRTASMPHPTSENESYTKAWVNDCTGSALTVSTGTGTTYTFTSSGAALLAFTPSGVQQIAV